MIKKQRIVLFIKGTGFVVLLVWLGVAMAVLPQSISYQGYLTNPDGSPVETPANITFRLYNMESGGIPLWFDTQPVSIEQGLFNVELGPGAPFPPNLFDEPLWLGIQVGTDGEMSPRQPLTSIGYAFKAGDAQTVEGISASTLDQSAHVAAINNPHNVTAAQTGAATPADIGEHAATANAHHSRYTDAEAVAAVQSHDGAGVNADTLDGNDSAAFARTTHLHNAIYYTQLQVDSLLKSRDAAIDNLQTRIEQLEEKLAKVTVSPDGNQIYVTSANLHLRSGSGLTDGAVNGLGNLIVGYDEASIWWSCSLGTYFTQAECENAGGQWWLSEKSGSHNLVVGSQHNYSRYGGIVVGWRNTISGNYSSVSGGQANTASGNQASVSGGRLNAASGVEASVSGGRQNTASNTQTSVSGGLSNIASDLYASVSGGGRNTASGERSWVGGGYGNTASAYAASVSGGEANIAEGYIASVIGGARNTASARYASVSGGSYNTASGEYSSVAGGGSSDPANGNHAYANYSAILGGIKNTTGDPVSGNHALGERSTVSGGDTNFAKGTSSTVSGGVGNHATGLRSAISGGSANATSSEASTVSGGANNSATAAWSVVGGGFGDQAATNYSWCAAGLGTCAP